MKVFVNAKLILPDTICENGFLIEDQGKISELGPMCKIPQGGSWETIPCEGLYLAPGFIDIHTHGGGGSDFTDGTPEAIVKAAQFHLRHGATTIVPTSCAGSDENLFRAIGNFLQVRKTQNNMPCLPGLHLEGPYFNKEQAGAQNPAFIRNPSPEHYNKVMEAAEGSILRWSVAPELEGALEMARSLAPQGVVFSIAHSNAVYDEVLAAAGAGFTHITHLYSGMSAITRRQGYRFLGVTESAYLLDSLSVEIIADGIHLPPELLKLIVKCKDNDKICLITDSMRGAGMGDGPSVLGGLDEGQPVIIEGGIAKLPDRSAFAGSIASSDLLVRIMVQKAGLSIRQAVNMITQNPARIMGFANKGSLESGKDADLVLFDEGIKIRRVFVNGGEAAI
ncbi:MAG: N-acetylglucosamine-6-phosphate deacetylase [Treponema sp.]|jgi:N-acetylglucosamine-6-phosphate deacetylase|nr:N-acetylglucosamine-6-phosphate deacetylase [Treponema sp.]